MFSGSPDILINCRTNESGALPLKAALSAGKHLKPGSQCLAKYMDTLDMTTVDFGMQVDDVYVEIDSAAAVRHPHILIFCRTSTDCGPESVL